MEFMNKYLICIQKYYISAKLEKFVFTCCGEFVLWCKFAGVLKESYNLLM
jgi:hypothetical protein